MAVLALDMRRDDAADAPSALVLLLVAVAASQSLLVVRGQLFSLALFPVVVLVLRDQARLPSQTIWVLPPLFALWSNLHGGVLVGIAVAGAYLLFHRLRRTPGTAIAVLVASLAAVLRHAVAPRHAPLLPGRPRERGRRRARRALGAALARHAARHRILRRRGATRARGACLAAEAWELVALTGLAAMTVQAGRNAVWLVVFAAVPAARWLTGTREWRIRPPRFVTGVLAAMLALLLAVGLGRAVAPPGAGDALRARAALEAGSAPILADDINAEALALDGRLVWIANPLDAFDARRPAPLSRLDRGPRSRATRCLESFPAVLVTADSPPARAARPARRLARGRAGRARGALRPARRRPQRVSSAAMAVATGREYGLFIDGGMAEPASGEVVDSSSPRRASLSQSGHGRRGRSSIVR